MCILQMRWMRRNKFRVGRNFFGWAVENSTVYVAGGRIDSRSLRCATDIRCLEAERIVRGCDSSCDTLNDPADDRATTTPWRVVGQLPAAMCVFAHCVVTVPVMTDKVAEAVAAISTVHSAAASEPAQTRPTKC